MVNKSLFLYTFGQKEGVFVYDNDIFLLFLDDDLFWMEDEDDAI